MIDRIFDPALTFTLLAGGTLAIGSALFDGHPPRAHMTPAPGAVQTARAVVKVVQLERVLVVGKRTRASNAVARSEAFETGAPRVH